MRTDKQAKWDSENMAYQTIKIRKTLLQEFKIACTVNGDKVNTVLREAMEQYISCDQKKKRRYTRTEEQRKAYNEYQRRYRAEHKDKVRQWQDNYIIRKAVKLKGAKNEH